MDGSLHTALWLMWAFMCAYGVRVAATRLLRSRLGGVAQFAAYGVWLVLLAVGWVLVGLSGMQMYGFDASDPRQLAGYGVLYYSPFGLPTAVGAPAVIVVDIVRAMSQSRRSRHPA
jgi:hypothetical protein